MGVAQVVPGLVHAGIQFHRPAVTADRLTEIFYRIEYIAQVIPGLVGAGLEVDHLAIALDGGEMIGHVGEGHSQVVPGRGITG